MDNRYGDRDDRWRARDEGRVQGRSHEQRSYGQNRESGRAQQGGHDDRGFMDRAGDEVRSWFGDDEAERRREEDDRRWERERGMTGRRDNQSGRDHDSSAGYRGTSGGWGNQSGESWNRERPGTPGSYGAYGAGERESSGRERREEQSGSGRGYGEPTGGGGAGGGYGGGAGIGASRGYSSSAAPYAAARQGSQQGGQSQQGGAARSIGGGGLHDPHYSEWRNRQIESIDRDYDEYRREHQSRFEQDFGNWRTKRGEQRQSMGRVTEHMEVFGSDGEKLGTVEAVQGDRIMLTKNDENAGGHKHSIPCSWIDKVDERVTVNKTRDEAMREWRDEERSRALFEEENQGSSGPHVLNRSFSGTY